MRYGCGNRTGGGVISWYSQLAEFTQVAPAILWNLAYLTATICASQLAQGWRRVAVVAIAAAWCGYNAVPWLVRFIEWLW